MDEEEVKGRRVGREGGREGEQCLCSSVDS